MRIPRKLEVKFEAQSTYNLRGFTVREIWIMVRWRDKNRKTCKHWN